MEGPYVESAVELQTLQAGVALWTSSLFVGRGRVAIVLVHAPAAVAELSVGAFDTVVSIRR
jgi:hypothetical protein